MDEKHDSDHDVKIAGFDERVVAFSLDLALFTAGYYLSLAACFPGFPVTGNPHANLWLALWAALFIIYQAYCSCEGRRSAGKAVLGLRVVSQDNEPLGLGQAVIRSATYLVSSFLNLGFLWALFNPSRQAWHDMAVGSFVVTEREASAARRALVRVGAGLCLVVYAGLWYWNAFAAQRYTRIMDVAYAKVGLREIVALEDLYHLKNGRYATNILALAPLTGSPKKFLRDTALLFDMDHGVKIKRTERGYSIEARARDDRRTLLAYAGP